MEVNVQVSQFSEGFNCIIAVGNHEEQPLKKLSLDSR